MTALIVLAATVVSLFGYVLLTPASRRTIQLEHPDDYFLARAKHSGSEFAGAQTAYALQMSTIYPFVLFASTGDYVLAVWNTFFYFVGILLFRALEKKFTRPDVGLGASETI